MKEKINSIINRKDWSFSSFLRKYWWIELLAVTKVIYFVNSGLYDILVGLSVIFGAIIVLWILYRLGLK